MKNILAMLVAMVAIFLTVSYAKGDIVKQLIHEPVKRGTASVVKPHPSANTHLLSSAAPATLTETHTANAQPPAPPSSYKMHVPPQDQNPGLYNGCEVTSVSMLLTAAGHSVSKMDLANAVAKDPTREQVGEDGLPTYWGNPNVGFVGDISGASDPGFGVYHGPITALINQYVPGQALDLTGQPFGQILAKVASGKPVIVWTTADFQPTSSWITWQSPEGPVRATFDEHVVLVVGYSPTQIYVNDPLDGSSEKAVPRDAFMQTYEQLGRQAVSIQ